MVVAVLRRITHKRGRAWRRAQDRRALRRTREALAVIWHLEGERLDREARRRRNAFPRQFDSPCNCWHCQRIRAHPPRDARQEHEWRVEVAEVLAERAA